MARGGQRVSRSSNHERRKALSARDLRIESSKLVPSTSNYQVVAIDHGRPTYERFVADEVYDKDVDQIVEIEVEDRSLTSKLHLRLFPQRPVRGYLSKTRQLDKKTGKIVEGSDIVITKMSDKTLLNRGLPAQAPKDLKRQTSVSKRIRRADVDMVERREARENPLTEIDFDAKRPSGRKNVSSRGVSLNKE